MRVVLYIDYFDGTKWTSREVSVKELATQAELADLIRCMDTLGFKRSKTGRLIGDTPIVLVKDESP